MTIKEYIAEIDRQWATGLAREHSCQRVPTALMPTRLCQNICKKLILRTIKKIEPSYKAKYTNLVTNKTTTQWQLNQCFESA